MGRVWGLLRGKKRNFRDFPRLGIGMRKRAVKKNLGVIREAGTEKKEAREDV